MTGNKFTSEERRKIVEALWNIVKDARRPISRSTLINMLNNPRICSNHVFAVKFREMMKSMTGMVWFSRGARARMLWGTRTSVSREFLEKIRAQAIVKLNNRRRIVYYKDFIEGGPTFGRATTPDSDSEEHDDEENYSDDEQIPDDHLDVNTDIKPLEEIPQKIAVAAVEEPPAGPLEKIPVAAVEEPPASAQSLSLKSVLQRELDRLGDEDRMIPEEKLKALEDFLRVFPTA